MSWIPYDKASSDTNRLPGKWAESYPVVVFLWWQVQELESIMLPHIFASIRVKQLLLLWHSTPVQSIACAFMPYTSAGRCAPERMRIVQISTNPM